MGCSALKALSHLDTKHDPIVVLQINRVVQLGLIKFKNLKVSCYDFNAHVSIL